MGALPRTEDLEPSGHATRLKPPKKTAASHARAAKRILDHTQTCFLKTGVKIGVNDLAPNSLPDPTVRVTTERMARREGLEPPTLRFEG